MAIESDASRPPLHIAALGRLEISHDGQSLAHRLPLKGQALLVYLALVAQPCSRSALAGLLWPEMPEESARTNLRLTLSRLRRHLPADSLLATRQTVAFNLARAHHLDATELQTLAARPQATAEHELDAALQRVRGEFLQDFALPDAPAFEQWLLACRQRYRQLALDAYDHLLNAARRRHDFSAGIRLARRQLTLEPGHEEGHRRLMWLLASSGQRAAALAQYEICRRLLQQELDVEPGAETVALYERIRDERIAPPPSTTALAPDPAPRRPSPTTTLPSLPPQLTPFVGRQLELAQLQDRLLDPDYRLLTIVGQGGVGKTRLALALAARLRGHFADGVYFAPLAELPALESQANGERDVAALETSLVVALGAALGLSFATAQEPRTQLRNYLRHRTCLLLLDNFEALRPCASLLVDLLHNAPRLTLLLTSRLPLNLQAEYLFRLEGLKVPPDARPQDIAAYDSLLLFQERAERATGRALSLEQNLSHVVRICHAVEGLPLGIELAASWLRWHTPQEIAAALTAPNDGVAADLPTGDLATRTPQDLAPRHRSLRAVFHYSWRLLAPETRRVLAQLSQFQGPFSAEAALFVTAGAPAELAALVDSSLLQRSLEGYYHLHSLVRRFANEMLAGLDLDPTPLRERHMVYYMDFIGGLSPALNGPDPRSALQRAQAQIANLQQAWRLAATAPHPASLARGLQGMVDYWSAIGLFREAQEALTYALRRLQEMAPGVPPDIMAPLHSAYAGMLYELGHYEQAEEQARLALALAREHDLSPVTAAAHLDIGRAFWGQGHFKLAHEQFEQALQVARHSGDAPLQAVILRNLAAVFWRNADLAQARAHCEEARSLNLRLGNVRNESKDNLLLGIIADNEHRYDDAHAIFEQVLQLGRQTGDRRVVMAAYAEIGVTAGHQGRLDRALHYLQQNLALVRESGSLWHEGVTTANLGDLKLKLGDFSGAESAYRAALDLARQARAPALESNVLSFWSLLDDFIRRPQAGIERAQESLQLARQMNVPRELGFALQFLGHNLLAAGLLAEARDCYREARATWQALQDHGRALESLAGLARVALAAGDAQSAMDYVGEILIYLQEDDLEGADDPSRVYLICLEILNTAGDSRAHDILQIAARRLQERAARIGDATLRHSFLENVPSNAHLRRLALSTFEQPLPR